MAAQGSRTLKLSLLADVAEFTKGIKTAGKDTESIGDQFTAFGKKAALAFAAAGAAIGAFAADSIKNAAADEKAQRLLALTIENTTNATAAQIAGVEKYISTTSIAIGVTDDELRPAFARLTRSTKDVEDAQKLLNLALDISSATGKPLEAVANALGKAYDGNLASLGRLGLGIDQSILKSKDFDLVFNTLTDTFGGFADNEAQSAEKAFARIKIATDEVQEQIGAALLPVIQELTAFILSDVVPVVQSFVDGLTGQDGLKDGLTDSQVTAIEWGKKVKGVITTVIALKDQLIALAAVIGTVFVVSKISAAVVATIALINTLIKAYNLLKASAIVAGVASAFALNPLLGVGAVALAAGVLAGANALARSSDVGGAETFATSGTPRAISGGGSNDFQTPEQKAQLAASKAESLARSKIIMGDKGGTEGVAGAGSTDSQNTATFIAAAAAASASMSDINARTIAIKTGERGDVPSTVVINVNAPSIIDEEGFSRATANAFNNSTFRGTNGAANLVYL